MSAPGIDEHRSICRTCENMCAVVVTTEDGRIVDVAGDPDNPLYRGYTCAGRREHTDLYDSPDRLVSAVVRHPDGARSALTPDAAIRGIARTLAELRERHGPASIALFQGPHAVLDHPASLTMVDAFMRALGSPMLFRPEPADPAGRRVARARHGRWGAPGLGAQDPDAVLLVGADPLAGRDAWQGDPEAFAQDLDERDVSMVVIDPRTTETARRADVHLQARPGHEVALLAAMLKIVFDEELEDADFLAENAGGVTELRAAVQRFDAAEVAQRAGVPVADLRRAALLFGEADRAYAAAASGAPAPLEYLLLVLQTVCGYWARAGDPVPNALTLVPAYGQPGTAQAMAPVPADDGEPVRRLGEVRALLSLGGNPATGWPGALSSLELLVVTDVTISATARLAHYVIGTTLPYEMPGTTFVADALTGVVEHLGMRRSYAQYTPPIVRPSAHVLDHPEFLFKLAQRLDLQLEVYPGTGSGLAGGTPVALDMERDLDSELLFELVHRGSRVPLAEVMSRPGGAFYPEPPVTVAAKDDGWAGRLDVGNPEMLAELAQVEHADRAVGAPV